MKAFESFFKDIQKLWNELFRNQIAICNIISQTLVQELIYMRFQSSLRRFTYILRLKCERS